MWCFSCITLFEGLKSLIERCIRAQWLSIVLDFIYLFKLLSLEITVDNAIFHWLPHLWNVFLDGGHESSYILFIMHAACSLATSRIRGLKIRLGVVFLLAKLGLDSMIFGVWTIGMNFHMLSKLQFRSSLHVLAVTIKWCKKIKAGTQE